jgi:hypothetical protein
MPLEAALSQSDADALIILDKKAADNARWYLPSGGVFTDIPLVSVDEREKFRLGIRRAYIELTKFTFTNLVRENIMLVRLDLSGSGHENPDGEKLQCPHVHIYREGYGDKWARVPPADILNNLGNVYDTLDSFMRFCHVVRFPIIERELFQ